MKTGIIYINYGQSHIARMCVSITTLRRHYSGAVTVYCDNGGDKKLKTFFKKHKITVKTLKTRDPNLTKLEALKKTKYDCALYIDSDTIIKDKLNHIFTAIKDNGLAIANYMDFRPTDSFIMDRLRVFKHLTDLYDDAMNHPVAVTGGILGIQRNHPIMNPLEQFTEYACDNNFKHAFDASLTLLSPQYDHWIMSAVNCMSSRYNNKGLIPKIIHFHGNRHTVDDCPFAEEWIMEFKKIKSEIPLGDDPQIKKLLNLQEA